MRMHAGASNTARVPAGAPPDGWNAAGVLLSTRVVLPQRVRARFNILMGPRCGSSALQPQLTEP